MAELKSRPETHSTLGTLRALLQTAAAVVDDLASVADPLLARLTRVFARMPAEDREAIVAVLEREVGLRLLTNTPGRTPSGFDVGRPNPNARLYTRVFGPAEPYHSRDELMLAALRAARMMLLAPASLHDEWQAATLEAFRLLEPAERAAVTRYNREMLALLDCVEAAKAN